MNAEPEDRGRLAAALTAVLVVAVFARWLAFTGFFGSDEVTYTGAAFRMLDGDWTVDQYVGANRLGVNFPVAGFAWLFGRNEGAAALYSLLSSLGEVSLVTYAAFRMFGSRAALFAGLLMATLPGHVHFAGRLMADAPLCLTITAAFVLFYEAEARQWTLGYFLAGVCAGLSFWVKPAAIFIFSVFVFYPLVARRIDWRWLWMPAGLLAAIAGNFLLFLALTGNFWFLVEAMAARSSSGYLEEAAAAGSKLDSPLIYLQYLFLKVYHTGLLGYLALAGAVGLFLRRRTLPGGHLAASYAVFWACGLLLVLSVMVVRTNPLMFVPKQVNYMLIFMAPLCLLGGLALARLPTRLGAAVAALAAGLGLVFAVLLQGSVAVFTANSWGTVRHAQAHPEADVFVMSNAFRAAEYEALIGGGGPGPRVRHIAELVQTNQAEPPAGADRAERFAVIDEESFSWDSDRPFRHPTDVPSCWVAVGVIQPEMHGIGVTALQAAATLTAGVPGVGDRLQRMSHPRPARVYRVPTQGC